MDIVYTNLAERYVSSVMLFGHGPLFFFRVFYLMVGVPKYTARSLTSSCNSPDEVHAVESSSS